MTRRLFSLLAAAVMLVVAIASTAAALPRESKILGGDICGEMGIYGTKPFSPIPAYSDGPRISRVYFSGTSGPCGEFRLSLEITDRRGDDVSGTDDDVFDQGRVEIFVPGIPRGGFTITRKALRDVGFVGFVTGMGYSRWNPDQAFLLDAVLDPATGSLTLV